MKLCTVLVSLRLVLIFNNNDLNTLVYVYIFERKENFRALCSKSTKLNSSLLSYVFETSNESCEKQGM